MPLCLSTSSMRPAVRDTATSTAQTPSAPTHAARPIFSLTPRDGAVRHESTANSAAMLCYRCLTNVKLYVVLAAAALLFSLAHGFVITPQSLAPAPRRLGCGVLAPGGPRCLRTGPAPRFDQRCDRDVLGAGKHGGVQGLPNLSQIQELDELLFVLRPLTAELESWEAALAMNHLARLQKTQRQQPGTQGDQAARAEANRLVAALAARVVDGADTLRPKAFAWALNACVNLPPRISIAVHSPRGGTPGSVPRPNLQPRTWLPSEKEGREETLQKTSEGEAETLQTVARYTVLAPVVDSMLKQLPRFRARTDVGVQNLALFASAVASLEDEEDDRRGAREAECNQIDSRLILLVDLVLAQGEEAWAGDGHALAMLASSFASFARFPADETKESGTDSRRYGEEKGWWWGGGEGGMAGVAEMLRRCAEAAALARRLKSQDVAMLAHALGVSGLLYRQHSVNPAQGLSKAVMSLDRGAFNAQVFC